MRRILKECCISLAERYYYTRKILENVQLGVMRTAGDMIAFSKKKRMR